MDPDKTILYTTDCPKCRVLEKKLNGLGIIFEKNGNIDEMAELGIMQAPMLKIDGRFLDFAKANEWLKNYISRE